MSNNPSSSAESSSIESVYQSSNFLYTVPFHGAESCALRANAIQSIKQSFLSRVQESNEKKNRNAIEEAEDVETPKTLVAFKEELKIESRNKVKQVREDLSEKY